MSEQQSSNQKAAGFKQAPTLGMTIDRGGGCSSRLPVAENYRGHDSLITIHSADLDVAQARELRDWLNKVLP